MVDAPIVRDAIALLRKARDPCEGLADRVAASDALIRLLGGMNAEEKRQYRNAVKGWQKWGRRDA